MPETTWDGTCDKCKQPTDHATACADCDGLFCERCIAWCESDGDYLCNKCLTRLGATMKEPAFHPNAHLCSDAECAMLSGMSLRDYFAAQALIAMAPAASQRQMGDSEVAQCAYALADAMLRERERQVERELASSRT